MLIVDVFGGGRGREGYVFSCRLEKMIVDLGEKDIPKKLFVFDGVYLWGYVRNDAS